MTYEKTFRKASGSGCDRMVARFTTTFAIRAYRH